LKYPKFYWRSKLKLYNKKFKVSEEKLEVYNKKLEVHIENFEVSKNKWLGVSKKKIGILADLLCD